MKRKIFILSLILALIAAGCCFAWAESDNGEDAHSQSMSAEAGEEPEASSTAQEFPDVESSDEEVTEDEDLPDDELADDEQGDEDAAEDAEDEEEEVQGGAIPLQIPWAIIIVIGVLIVLLFAVIPALSRRHSKDQYKGRH